MKKVQVTVWDGLQLMDAACFYPSGPTKNSYGAWRGVIDHIDMTFGQDEYRCIIAVAIIDLEAKAYPSQRSRHACRRRQGEG